MKANLIEMLKAQGFSEVESKSETIQQCNGVILQRDWSREVEVAFQGQIGGRSDLLAFAVRVFVNRNSGICHVSYQKDGREYKDRWYDTIGKRTYNAIVETARCAGYAI